MNYNDNLKQFYQSKYNNKNMTNKRFTLNSNKKDKKKFYTKQEDFSIVHQNKSIFYNYNIKLSNHAENRKIERNISKKDVKKCIKNGKCIQVQYSYLKKYVYVYEYNNICVVYSVNDKLNIITVYKI